MSLIQLETDRTFLIPFQTHENLLFHRINTDPFVRKNLWDNDIISLDTAQEIMNANAQYFTERQFGLWKIQDKESKHILGYAGLWYFFDESQPQLLYALLEPYTGKGLATECASQVVNYALEILGFDYVIAATDQNHSVSQRVAQRIGMRFVEERVENGKRTYFYRIDK